MEILLSLLCAYGLFWVGFIVLGVVWGAVLEVTGPANRQIRRWLGKRG